jgi:prepilin-type N-terminal cleavage/methylation domain-containing protein
MPPRDAQAGFTLIEVVCELAIIALLAALVLPAIPRGTVQERLAGYAVEVAALLKATATPPCAVARRWRPRSTPSDELSLWRQVNPEQRGIAGFTLVEALAALAVKGAGSSTTCPRPST